MKQCRHRHRLAFAAGRRRHGRHGAPDGRRRGAARLVRRQSGRRARHAGRRDHGRDRGSLVGAGVAILVDLGGAETNSEMAVEMIGEPRSAQDRHLQCADRRGRGDGRDRGVGRRVAQAGRGDGARIVAGMNEQEADDVGDSSGKGLKSPTRSGLHARPSVKFTKLAKTFAARGRGGACPRRAVVRRQKHRQGDGGQGAQGHGAASCAPAAKGAESAVKALVALVERDFDEAAEGEAHVRTA